MMMMMIVGEDYVRPVPDLAAGPLSWGHFSLSHANWLLWWWWSSSPSPSSSLSQPKYTISGSSKVRFYVYFWKSLNFICCGKSKYLKPTSKHVSHFTNICLGMICFVKWHEYFVLIKLIYRSRNAAGFCPFFNILELCQKVSILDKLEFSEFHLLRLK